MTTPGVEPTTRNDDVLRAAVEKVTGRPASLDIVQKSTECPQWNRDEDGNCLDHPPTTSNPLTGLWSKRNTPSGAFEAVKRSGDVFRGVKREN